MNPVEIAGHPGAQIDGVDRVEAPDEVVVLDDLLDHGLGDGDRRRGCLRKNGCLGPDE